ncbi:homeobox protein Meis3-like [Panonychus citri]|uniref:homeobox protein Meis3-like n=1 Tax=Panonychus citri TaxID=50023 RepID=UPI002307D0BF|nr:homeobox protein Meis3-like [Panonychus citri]XP_053206392.1 homeobox protein Meis3-like [Panonychus citri]
MNPPDISSDCLSDEDEDEFERENNSHRELKETEEYANCEDKSSGDNGEDNQLIDKPNSSPNQKETSDNPADDLPIQHDEHLIKDIAQFDNYKNQLYKHPLYPLLALLLEKCEIATATLGVNDEPFASGETFNSELRAAIESKLGDEGLILGENPEVDNLMIKAIQVLRIHLLELEKVQDLCKDFCFRYINCLRTKMNSENLLRGTSSLHGSFDNSSCSSSSSDECSSGPSNYSFNDPSNSVPTDFQTAIAQDLTKNKQTHQQNQSKYKQQQSEEKTKDPDKEKSTENQPQDNGANKPLNLTYRIDSGTEGDLSDEASNVAQKRNQKRGILPKQATSVMRSWLFQHIVHPYPTEDEKRSIAAQTNLTLLQVNNWFINARRRILQPMLDSANINNNSTSETNPEINNSSNTGNQSINMKETNSVKKLKTSNGTKSSQKNWSLPISNTIDKVSGSTEQSTTTTSTRYLS